jgi:hypothetical protein
MEWLKKKTAQQEHDRANKRLLKLESLALDRDNLSIQIERLTQSNQVNAVELAGLTAVFILIIY